MVAAIRVTLALAFAGILSGCATTTVAPYARPSPERAMPARAEGVFYALESAIQSSHGPDMSGFELLDSNEDGLRWRLVLIDSARYSIDVQYYLWYGDTAGRLIMKRLLDAADRGVKIRILVDDLNTMFSDAGTITLRDQVAAWADAHPNLELRLFNPWLRRDIAARLGESIGEFARVNQRMHNKALIVDNRAVILGGRNIGDEYMGLNTEFNFHDLDVLGIGPVARQASEQFDLYWNSAWVMPVSALAIATSADEQAAGREKLRGRLEGDPSLELFPLSPQPWSAELAAVPGSMHIGTSRVIADRPVDGAIEQLMLEEIRAMIEGTRSELLIVNAYIIPADEGVRLIERVSGRGAEVKILTNSLASHDVPAVNSHYKHWRRPLLEAGAELYELRHDAEIQALVCDTPPLRAEFVGLHSKAMVVDRQRIYIGSMNYDPRSALYNTEMGVIIESPGLGNALAELIERDIDPANSWQVRLDGHGGLRWETDEHVVTRQPARSWWQRVQDLLFGVIPKEYY